MIHVAGCPKINVLFCWWYCWSSSLSLWPLLFRLPWANSRKRRPRQVLAAALNTIALRMLRLRQAPAPSILPSPFKATTPRFLSDTVELYWNIFLSWAQNGYQQTDTNRNDVYIFLQQKHIHLLLLLNLFFYFLRSFHDIFYRMNLCANTKIGKIETLSTLTINWVRCQAPS